ncbi:hypothetical protein GYMLUDRAFT_251844 [Collybiopsis luxurians FD-317 M1]|uniref:Uncharacterized protein n=1 Tax=Collybiopsis luxurians FD-317 M1 TaxID=944289 RepID=A0A0D0C1P6_9AGAR|nr:hypothetical protein GYMLUDRAFT_251844 [Collybiopsis luxurians FD-317 M1]
MSQINRIYISENLQLHCDNWEISNEFAHMTDHSMVSVVVNTPGIPYQGKGRYTMSPKYLEKPHLIKTFSDIGSAMEDQCYCSADPPSHTDNYNPQLFLQRLKEEMVKEERQYHKKTVGSACSKIDETTAKAAKVQRDIEVLVSKHRNEAKSNRLLLNELEGDYVTEYSAGRMREQKTQDPIYTLKYKDPLSAETKYKKQSDHMVEIVCNYHSALQHDDSEDQPALKEQHIQDALKDIRRSLTDEQSCKTAKLVSEEFVSKALKMSKKGVAAGIDGCITEV